MISHITDGWEITFVLWSMKELEHRNSTGRLETLEKLEGSWNRGERVRWRDYRRENKKLEKEK